MARFSDFLPSLSHTHTFPRFHTDSYSKLLFSPPNMGSHSSPNHFLLIVVLIGVARSKTLYLLTLFSVWVSSIVEEYSAFDCLNLYNHAPHFQTACSRGTLLRFVPSELERSFSPALLKLSQLSQERLPLTLPCTFIDHSSPPMLSRFPTLLCYPRSTVLGIRWFSVLVNPMRSCYIHTRLV